MSLIDGLFIKYTPPENQVRVKISNLVPFQGFPWEKFRGLRLEKMIDNIRFIGVYMPITVRPMNDGKYEILDGHYRVAAAKYLAQKGTILEKAELYVTVPAIVLEGLSDEEAELYVSDTNPVGLSKKYGIDIYDPNYRESNGYRRMEYAKVVPYKHLSMALDEYIERYLLNKYTVSLSYLSFYSMGNPYELDDDDCSDFALARAIVTESHHIEDDKQADENPELADEALTLEQRFKGYIQQLKKHMGVDLDSFSYDSLQNKRERVKILYLFYKVKEEIFPNVNVPLMLSKPSMENNALASLGVRGTNWEYINFLRHEVEKELPIETKETIRRKVTDVVIKWENYIQELISCVENYYDTYSAIPKKLDRVKAALEASYPDNNKLSGHSVYGLASPLETMFLKLVQYKYLSAQMDFLYVLDASSHMDYSVPAEYVEQMEKFEETKICVNESNDVNESDDDVSPKCLHGYVIEREGRAKKVCGSEELDKFFSSKNVQKIAKYVYLKEDISKEERRAIRNSKGKLCRFLGFLQFIDTDDAILDDVTELLIISCLQLICWDNGKEILDYTFQGFEGTPENRKGKIHVQAALKNDKRVYEVVKMYWMRKVAERMYANLGKAALPKKIRELQNLYLKLLEKLLKAPDIETMLSISSFYERKLQGKIIRVTFQEKSSIAEPPDPQNP